MAITTVEGTVGRIFYNGRGAEVAESFVIAGKPVTKRWAVWFEQPHGLSEGQQVKVSGLHGDELSEWESEGVTKRTVKRSLNKARILGGAEKSEPDVWAASSEVPF